MKSDKGRDSNVPLQSDSHSRHSSRSVSALLLLANERLNNATNRVTTLESDQEELLKRFGSMYKEKLDIQSELYSTQESLRLHKMQLELARKEIDRANELLHELDRQRTRADSDATKLRNQVRMLEEEKRIRIGWDEGWDLGFKEGYERAQREGNISNLFNLRRRRRGSRDRSDRGDDYTDGGYDDDTTNREESTMSSPRRVRSNSTRSQASARSPDAAPHVPPLPIPTISTPVPLDVPSTQLQQPQMSPSATAQRESLSRGRTQSQSISSRNTSTEVRRRTTSNTGQIPRTLRRNTAPSSVPPNVEPQTRTPTPDSPEIIRPISIPRPSSAAASFRSRSTAPPDGFIPVGDDDGFITLPPPHEMSIPVPPTTSRSTAPQGSRAPPSHIRDFGDTPRNPDVDISRASSRISHYELISPPRKTAAQLGLRVVNDDTASAQPTRGPGDRRSGPERPSTPSVTSSSSKEAVEQWRNEIVSDVPNPERRTTPAATPQPDTGSSSAKRSNLRPRTPRVSMGPRQPRDIIMPTPLAAAANNMLPQTRQATPYNQRPEGRADPNLSARSPIPEASRPENVTQPVANNGGERGGPAPLRFAWLRSRFQRSTSSPAPVIEVEPPSQTPSSGTNTTAFDPVLLTPEDANRPIPLPNEVVSDATRGIRLLSPSTPIPHTPITIQLPDEDLPLGFVPMTPLVPSSPQLHQSPDQSRVSSPRSESRGFFSPVPSLGQLQVPPSPPTPPTRPATASGMTRPPLSTTPGGERGALRAMSMDAPLKDRGNTSTSPILGGYLGWASPTPSLSSFMRPPASVFGDDD
ncbi:hypothetical protein E1B28_009081 [Marasmius oreades]|uniref:Uncharacterized protein n=1 Tax=Marasmius oreades TaxID=181124 RepID=A0A9P7S0C9_9AGAR|nr:uncharacterized protein E1B28_009081 [Marasmius oreades]KAG7092755.1 hypothetical protein E1B28_009081 [Marasmius oreades]